jgi:hypothetical protein
MGSMDGRIDGQELWLKYESDYRREGDLPSNDTGVDHVRSRELGVDGC